MANKLNPFEFFWYRIIKNFPDILREIKWFLQKLFRGYSDPEVWGFSTAWVKKIYPAFKAYMKMEKHGYGLGWFDDPTKLEHSDEDFEKAEENLNKVLEKILFAFEFIMYDSGYFNEKKQKEFEEKYGNPYEEIESNKHTFDSSFLKGEVYYINQKMLDEFYAKQDKGIKLFAKHYNSFWD